MMDVDEMFAIEEEIIVDPEESLKESLRRIDRKKENKRKWRRKKRERLRQNEQCMVNNEDKISSVEDRINIEGDERSEGLRMDIKDKESSTNNMGLCELNMSVDTEDKEGSNIQENDGIDGNLDCQLTTEECSTNDIGLFEWNTSKDPENSGRKYSQDNLGNDEHLHQQPKEDNVQNDMREKESLREENRSCNLSIGIEGKKCTTTNMDAFESVANMDADNCEISTKDILPSIDVIDENIDQQQVGDNVQNDRRKDLENARGGNQDSVSPKTDLQGPECSHNNIKPIDIANKKVSIDKQESRNAHSFSENIDDDKSKSLVQASMRGERTQDPFSDGEDRSVQMRESFCSGEDEGGIKLVKERSDRKDLSAREVESKDDSFVEETINNEVTICDIMEEVKQTETELEAGTLLASDKNTDTYLYKPNAILQSNVLAMEFDEGSQDSTVFDRERAGMLLQTVTLHHKITYGMEDVMGVMKEDCEEVGSKMKGGDDGGNGDDGGDSEDGGGDDDGNDNDNVEDGSAVNKVGEKADGDNGNQDGYYKYDDGDNDCEDGGNDGNSNIIVAYGEEMVDSSMDKVGEKGDYGRVDGGDGNQLDDGRGNGNTDDAEYAGNVGDCSSDDGSCDGNQRDDGCGHGKDNDDAVGDDSDGISDDGIPDHGKSTDSHAGNNGDRSGNKSNDGEGTSHDHDDEDCDDGTHIVAHGKSTDDGAGNNDGEGKEFDDGTINTGSTNNGDGEDFGNVKNRDNDYGIEGNGIVVGEGTDGNLKERNIQKREELSSRIKDGSDDDCNDRKEQHSLADNEVSVRSTDVSQSGNIMKITKQERNIEEKEEGELSSSSDDKNVEERKDLQQDEKRHKAELEKVSVPKSHQKKSNIGPKSGGTTSKKTPRIRSEETIKRRHSISCTKESSCEIEDKRSDRSIEKSRQKFEKERRRSLAERGVDNDGRSSRKDKDITKSRKISLSKERKSEKESCKTIEKRRSSGTSQKLNTSSSTKHVRSKESVTKSKSSSRYDKHSDLNDCKKKVNKTANDNSLTKSEKDSCGKQRKQTEKAKGSGDKTGKDQTRHKEFGKRESRSGPVSSSRNLSSKKEKDLDEKHKPQVEKSGHKTSQESLDVEEVCKRTTRKSSTGSESSSKHFSNSRKDLKNKSNETQRKGKDVEPIRKVPEDSSKGNDRKSTGEKSTDSEKVRRSSYVQVKTRKENISDKKKNNQEERKEESRRTISKTKDKTESKTMKPGQKSELIRRENSGLKSRDKSSVKRKESSLKKGDSCKTGKTEEKKGPSKEDSLVMGKVASKNDDNIAEKLKKEKSVLKKSDESKNERKAKGKGFSKDDKHREEEKLKSLQSDNNEVTARETQKSIRSSSKVSKECRDNKINTTKRLESSKEKLCNSNEGTRKKNDNSVKQKDSGLKTPNSSRSSIAQQVKTEIPTGEEFVAKKKLSMEENKSRNRLESKEKTKSKSVINETDKLTQPKTLEKSEKSQQFAKSKPRGLSKQTYKGDVEKLSGKRKREDTSVDPRKTTKMDTNMSTVKTKEAKLPGNVVTVRVLKVDRGKALVLKRRHVNQLFIRGDNIIMVAYDNVEASDMKL